jgi:aryl carrier-like protein
MEKDLLGRGLDWLSLLQLRRRYREEGGDPLSILQVMQVCI